MAASSNTFLLTINCGSSSLKFSLYHAGSLQQELSGSVDAIGTASGKLVISKQEKPLPGQSGGFKNLDAAVKAVIRWIKHSQYNNNLLAIGHRLVQGGPNHRAPQLITDDLLKTLHQYVYLAPNHLPDEIKNIKAFQKAFAQLPQVACFDTAFHADMPDEAKYYPLPNKYREQGLLHYGFHGLSYEYIIQKLAADGINVNKQNIIIAHLGNGASMAAVKNGISVETTMGLSPIGGLVMGTRSGDLDPGVVLFLLKQGRLTAMQLDTLLSKQSGLKAIAGKSDMQELLNMAANDAKAGAAITTFCYQARKFIGSLAAAMGGLDLLVFTGGIGEHSAVVREMICRNLDFLGIRINEKLNNQHKENIGSSTSNVKVMVLKTNEEAIIAQHTQTIILK
ncbi:acetate/propionate family kinase [Mucilaginibacter ginsenosidivorax]|uniref:Acetate kinase n=1 Tax=Mucilaginibacter ginsenosidivorax TaxID=862126 RepID=A0A5B8W545_9SPHI|nr:acetate/propionate family kinase [Mucilaginibacter ginsenosidivorax]QEC78994.1 acetate/propionate family kinase [Mucilaginibacter ginsenosidivorax]